MKETCKLPNAIKAIVEKRGKDVANDVILVNIMDDIYDLDESRATKNVLKVLLNLGYGEKLESLNPMNYNINLKITSFTQEIVDSLGFEESVTRYVISSILFGLGYLPNIPHLKDTLPKKESMSYTNGHTSIENIAGYSNCSYKRLLDFFKLEDKYDSEGISHANILLSMEDVYSLIEMMNIYNRIFKKIAYYIFCRNLPNYWFLSNSWSTKKYLLYELNQCLNHNILRRFKAIESPTENDFKSSLVNFRESNDMFSIQKELINHFNSIKGDEVESIISIRNHLFALRNKIGKIETLNNYDYYTDYSDTMSKLLYFGYIKTIEEEIFEEKSGIKYNIWHPEDDETTEDSESTLPEKVGTCIGRVLAILIVVGVVFLASVVISKFGLIGLLIFVIVIVGIVLLIDALTPDS